MHARGSLLVILSVATALACGRTEPFDDAVIAPQPSPGPLDAGPPDAGPGPMRACDPGSPFGAVTALAPLNSTANEWSAAMPSDMLEVVLGTNRDPGTTLYRAARTMLLEPFGTPIPLNTLNVGPDNSDPTMTADGLELVFVSNRSGAAGLDLFISRRERRSVSFGNPRSLSSLNSFAREQTPALSAGGETICFSSERGGNLDVYCATRRPNGDYGVPVRQAGASSPAAESGLALSPDGLVLYIGSDSAGVRDIFRATRADISGQFGQMVPVPELNTRDFEYPTWLSADDCMLVFGRSVPGRGTDLFIARRGR